MCVKALICAYGSVSKSHVQINGLLNNATQVSPGILMLQRTTESVDDAAARITHLVIETPAIG